MKFYTKKWYDYINENYSEFITNFKTHINMKRIDSLTFNDDILKQEFDIYYNAKKEYINKYDYFEKEFGNYEKIELLDYDKEFELFKQRLDSYVKKYLKIIADDDKYDEIENDLYLFALNKITSKFNKIWKYNFYNETQFDNAYGFLTSYRDYYNSLSDKFDEELVFLTDFHDGMIKKFSYDGKDIIFVAENDSSYKDRYRYHFTIRDAKIDTSCFNKDLDELNNSYIMGLHCYNFEDKKYYIELEVETIVNNSYIVDENYNTSISTDDYIQNFEAFADDAINRKVVKSTAHFHDSIELWSDKIEVTKESINI